MAASLFAPALVGAQGTSGTIRVTVLADSLPVEGARISVSDYTVRTDAGGRARLDLPAGTHLVTAARLGYLPDTATVTLAAGADIAITLNLARRETELEEIIVSAARTERRVEDTPLRVEVLAREEIEEKMLMTPGDITMMLNETGGLRVQTTSPSLGGANVRVQGLRGRYTLMLSDGLPLFGGQSGTLSLLQIPPMDLAQVEVVKGVASALYGSAALGGVINLVTRRPEDEPERELLLNQTTRGGTDAILWASEQLSDAWGYTFLGSAHRQPRVDVDGEGWTDIAGYERFVARPRVFFSGERGRSLMLTAGSTLERRGGGTMPGALAPDGAPHVESLDTRRFDAGGVTRFPFGTSVLSARASASRQAHEHRFGDAPERDRHDSWFAEASLATTRGRHTTVLGAALSVEGYTGLDVPAFDYRYTIPAAFAQYDVDVGERLALSASGRADAHSEYGVFFNPRLSARYRLTESWTVRASAGTGTFAPTPLTEETEATGLRPVTIPEPLRAERARSASIDVGGSTGPVEVIAALFASRIAHPLMARAAASDPALVELFSAAEPTVTAGADAMLRLRLADVVTTASVTVVDSREDDPETGMRRSTPLTPRVAAGLVAVWEREGQGRVGLEYYYTGRQPLDDNPYLTESKAYSVFGAIAEWRVGRARLFVNLENIGGARLTRYHPLARSSPGLGGRWTTDAWAPLEGRVINGGVRLEW